MIKVSVLKYVIFKTVKIIYYGENKSLKQIKC